MSSSPFDPRSFPDATALAASIAHGERAADEVVRAHLDRLARVNPVLNAATEILGDEATEDATTAPDGPLRGVPISAKETIGIAGTTITAGSVRMPPQRIQRDAVMVQRLREAGAVVVARGNLPEFAMTHETDNLRYGATQNPLAPGRSPGGSSGGDAALVASGCVAAGLGSDIGGSIRYPAHCCGIVGFKPDSAAIDSTGTWPVRDEEGPDLFANSMLAYGPLTRSVRDARLVYNLIATTPTPEPAEINGLRLLVPEGFPMEIRDMAIASAVRRAQTAAVHAGMRALDVRVPDAAALYFDFLNVLTYDFGQPLLDGLKTPEGQPLSLSREAMRQLSGQPTVHWYLYRLLVGMPLVQPTPEAFAASVERIETARRTIYELLGTDGVMLLPTNGALAMKPGEAAAYMSRPGVRPLFTPTQYANVLNLPAISIPAWTDRDPATGLVPGVQLLCAPGAEGILFDAAAAVERVLNPPIGEPLPEPVGG